MAKPSTETPEILAARQRWEQAKERVELLFKELEEARDAVGDAYSDLAKLWREQDDALPKATRIFTCDGRVSGSTRRLVILRQTTTGNLVCREYGRPEAREVKYKPGKHLDACPTFYEVKEKGQSSFSSSFIEDAPQEYIDRASAAQEAKK